MDTLLPVLRPADWPDQAPCWSRPLLPLTGPGIPLLTLTQQVGPLLVTLCPERLALQGLTADQAETRALQNLARRPTPWRALQSATPRGGWIELQTLQGPLAASRILDARALLDLARQILGTETLAVAIPRPDLLLATPAAWALDGDLAAVAQGIHREAEQPLTPRCFLVDGGTIVGLVG